MNIYILSAKPLYKDSPRLFQWGKTPGAFHTTGINFLWNISEHNEMPNSNLNDAIARGARSKRCCALVFGPNGPLYIICNNNGTRPGKFVYFKNLTNSNFYDLMTKSK